MTDRTNSGISPVALVTGGGRRIGLRIAERLAGAGYAVVVHCGPASLEEAERAALRLRAGGGRAAALSLDLADAAATGALIAKAGAPFGPLTLLVNNASAFEPRLGARFRCRGFRSAYRREFARARHPLRATSSRQAPEGASIVNIVDQRVLRLTPAYFTYTLAKAALWTATRTMAQEFAPRGVRVNAVGPGPVFPNANEGEAGFLREVQGLPLGRAVSR